MDLINDYINQHNINNNNLDLDKLYKLLIDEFINKIPNYLYIINFIMYDRFKYYPYNNSNLDILSLAIERRGQNEFRINIINRDKVCLISGLDADDCDACHIIPYNECKNYNINNGILLNKTLHNMFDEYKFSINNNKVVLNNKILNKDNYSDYHKYHNKIINIPKECIDNLNKHYNEFIKKNL
jgi:hypothetical protein